MPMVSSNIISLTNFFCLAIPLKGPQSALTQPMVLAQSMPE